MRQSEYLTFRMILFSERRAVLFLCVASLSLARAWVNDYDGPVHFECPVGQFLSHVASEHSNSAEDRVWNFGCHALPVTTEATGECKWTENVNEFDQPLNFQCSNEGYIAGTASVHSNRFEDRRFQFKCCDPPGVNLHGCYFTPYANVMDGHMDYSVPNGKVMRGWDSYHDNGKEDRRTKFEICDMQLQP